MGVDQREYMVSYRAQHREEIRDYARTRYIADRTRIRAVQKLYDISPAGRATAAAWRQTHRAHLANRARDKRLLLGAFADAERARGCVDCGEKDLRVIDLDHVRGNKSDGIATLISQGCGLQRFFAELDKCEPRCSNCHRRVTAERRDA